MRSSIYIFPMLAALVSGCVGNQYAPAASSDVCKEHIKTVLAPMTIDDPRFRNIIGKPVSAVKSIEGYKIIRVVQPGSAMTMDYRIDRANLWTDCDDVILAVTVG